MNEILHVIALIEWWVTIAVSAHIHSIIFLIGAVVWGYSFCARGLREDWRR